MTTTQQPSPWIWVVVIAAFLAAAVSFGIRSSFGLFVLPITAEYGWTVATLSLALAIQNLMWGVGQPFAGMAADRYGAPIVLVFGGLLYASGLFVMANVDSEIGLHLSTGLIIGIAQSCIGFPVLLGAIVKIAPPAHKGLFMGIGTAGGSFGQLSFAPITRQLIDRFDWVDTLHILAIVALGICILGLVINFARSRFHQPQSQPQASKVQKTLYEIDGFKDTLQHAMRERGFLFLVIGFFVCGFQLAFIIVHLPNFAALCGLTGHVAANGIALIGAFNIIGSIVAGSIGDRIRPKFPLAYIYLGRSLATLPLVLLPVTDFSLYIFSIVMGLLWLSTVPLTNSVIIQLYGQRHAGTLFGITFFSHQIGSFIGVYASGVLYDVTGSYDLTWWGSIALGLFAFSVNLMIKDRSHKPKLA